MKMNVFRKVTVCILVTGALLAIVLNAGAGNLEPPTSPSSTMKTLDEIYANVQEKLPPKWAQHPDWSQITGATAIHMTINDDGGTPIEGSCTVVGRENTIVVIGLGHQVWYAYDSTQGQAISPRKHEPLTVLKYLDKSSPILYQMLCEGRLLTNVELKFYVDNHPGGGIQHYYTIVMESVRILDIKMAFPNVESVSFIYPRIRWTWEDGSITFEDEPYTGGS